MKFRSKHRGRALPLTLCLLTGTMLMPTASFADTSNPDYADILGQSKEYGIVAETFQLRGDAETNLAAKNVIGAGAQTGNDLTNHETQDFIIGNVDAQPYGFHIKGEPAEVHTTEEAKQQIVADGGVQITYDTTHSEAELDAAVDALLNEAEDTSNELADQNATASVNYDAPSQRYQVNTKGQPNGTYYIDVDQDTYSGMMADADKLQIQKEDGQTLVFNVAASGDLQMNKYSINYRGTDSMTGMGSESNELLRSVVWNFTEEGSLNFRTGVSGVILARDFDISTYSTGAGWIVAKDVSIESGEWHNTHDKVEKPDGELPEYDKPTDEDQPETPDQPKDETPDTPATPDKPETDQPGGETPDTPDTPENPDQPDTPDKPDTPDTPDKPDTPETPKDETPENPSDDDDTPDTPATPEKPDTPSDEEKPDQPKEETPDQPGDETPEEPTPEDENPDTPASPEEETPETPKTPEDENPEVTEPEKPEDETPENPEDKTPEEDEELVTSKETPDTGDHADLLFYSIMLAGAACASGTIMIRRKRNANR